MISVVHLVSPRMSATSILRVRYAAVQCCVKAQRKADWYCQVYGYAADKLDEALEGVDVVVIPAGVPRKVCFSSSYGRRIVSHAPFCSLA